MRVVQAQHAMTTMGSMSCRGIMEIDSERDSEMSRPSACSDASQSDFGSWISADIEVVVKNTFLELRVEASESKLMTRSKSCPALLRAESCLPQCPRSEALLGGHQAREEKPPQEQQEQALLAALLSESMVGVPTSPGEFNRLWAPVANELSQQMPSCPMPVECPRGQWIFSGLDHAVRTPLSAQARKWRPSGNVFFAEACKVAENVGRILEQTFGVSTEVQFRTLPDCSGKCTLVTTMSPGDLASLKSAVVEAAEAGVYERTNRTCGVCLLGCKFDPFKPLPTGFSASLANVTNKRRECRDMYKYGFCCRGPMCSKEHPSIIVDFEFTLLAGLPLAKHDTARESLTADSAAFLF